MRRVKNRGVKIKFIAGLLIFYAIVNVVFHIGMDFKNYGIVEMFNAGLAPIYQHIEQFIKISGLGIGLGVAGHFIA